MIQAGVRAWGADAVHDTVRAVMQTPPFRHPVQVTLLERLLGWIAQGLTWLSDYLGGLPAGRTVVIWLTALLAAALVGRALLAASARDPQSASGRGDGVVGRDENPWSAAERLAAAGDHEGAAHAIYRGVLSSLGQHEGLRLHASKTSGDYARDLRARGSPAFAPFRAFARRFDDAVYGHGAVDAALTSDLLQLATPMRRGARAA